MALSAMQDKLGLADRASDVERRLDDAVEGSFPASDPVSLAQPHDPQEIGISRSGMTPARMWLVGGGLLAAIALIAFRRR